MVINCLLIQRRKRSCLRGGNVSWRRGGFHWSTRDMPVGTELRSLAFQGVLNGWFKRDQRVRKELIREIREWKSGRYRYGLELFRCWMRSLEMNWLLVEIWIWGDFVSSFGHLRWRGQMNQSFVAWIVVKRFIENPFWPVPGIEYPNHPSGLPKYKEDDFQEFLTSHHGHD